VETVSAKHSSTIHLTQGAAQPAEDKFLERVVFQGKALDVLSVKGSVVVFWLPATAK
jgi:hypothetical protein